MNLLKFLHAFVSPQRDQLEFFEKAALNVKDINKTYKGDLQRSRKRKSFADEEGGDYESHQFTGRNKFTTETFYVVIDKLLNCIDHRHSPCKHLTDIFGVFWTQH